MFFGASEINVEELMLEHVKLVEKALHEVVNVVEIYNRDHTKTDDIEAATYEVHRYEHEADIIRRRIQQALAAGAFLPFYRQEYINLADRIDKIANRAVDFAKPIALEKPLLPVDMRPQFLELAKCNVTAFAPFHELIIALFNTPEKVQAFANKVSEAEQESDSTEWKLKKKIFADRRIDRAEQIVLETLIYRLADIANKIENAADMARIIVTKQA